MNQTSLTCAERHNKTSLVKKLLYLLTVKRSSSSKALLIHHMKLRGYGTLSSIPYVPTEIRSIILFLSILHGSQPYQCQPAWRDDFNGTSTNPPAPADGRDHANSLRRANSARARRSSTRTHAAAALLTLYRCHLAVRPSVRTDSSGLFLVPSSSPLPPAAGCCCNRTEQSRCCSAVLRAVFSRDPLDRPHGHAVRVGGIAEVWPLGVAAWQDWGKESFPRLLYVEKRVIAGF